MPGGPGVRVDAGIEADTDLRPEYDPLLAKLMVHAEDRSSAIDRLRRALDETVVGGVQTDAGFLRWLVDDEAFGGGDYDTGLIEERWGLDHRIGHDDAALAATAALAARLASDAARARPPLAADDGSAWGRIARGEARRR
jgi:acetyl/propionyl-CoA carboxylase alpha subunit